MPDKALKSIFVLRMKYSSDKIIYPTKLHCETLGYFSDLKKAEYYISVPNKDSYWFLEDHPFKIFEIEEYGLNYFYLHIRTKIYERNGKFYGEHLAEPEYGFQGRENNDCKFKQGDLVEFIDSLNNLDVGIIAGLPPNKKSVKEINKKTKKGSEKYYHVKSSVLDASDDCYLVLRGYDEADHVHPQVFNVFEPSSKIPKKLEKHLRTRYNWQQMSRIERLKKLVEKQTGKKIPIQKHKKPFLTDTTDFGRMLAGVE